MTPKSLLRHKDCVSTADLLTGGAFEEIIEDPPADARATRRVVLCSGKVYYDLLAGRRAHDRGDVALVRVEQLYPYPGERLEQLIRRYERADFVWAQEEPRNMGAWSFMLERLAPALDGVGRALRYVGRPRGGSPAAGSSRVHVAAQERLVRDALGDSPDPC
jgi:2-oxoglutarate dehydrogenase E1 component